MNIGGNLLSFKLQSIPPVTVGVKSLHDVYSWLFQLFPVQYNYSNGRLIFNTIRTRPEKNEMTCSHKTLHSLVTSFLKFIL